MELTVSTLDQGPARDAHQIRGAATDPSGTGEAAVTVPSLLARAAARSPGTCAVAGQDALTFRQAADLAGGVSRHLQEAGLGAGDVVALASGRSPHAALVAWGIMAAGCVYLPLDPSYPDEVLRLALEAARPRAVLIDAGSAHAWRERAPRRLVLPLHELLTAGARHRGDLPSREAAGIAEHDPAYVVLTSGTTGRPRGVVLSHGGFAAYAAALRRRIGTGPGDRCLWTAPLGFSSAMRQSLVTLAAGATLVGASDDDVRTPWRFTELIRRERITQVDLVPSFWAALLDASDADALRAHLATVRRFLFASERLDGALVQRTREVAAPDSRIWNLYGCTETSGIVAAHDATGHPGGEDDVPIGEPLGHVRLHVTPLGDGGSGGSLVVEGSAVALGHVGAGSSRPLPAQPGAHARRFDTGDVVAYDGAGRLAWLGRRERQSKVRGFRVRHDAVEATAARSPMVRRASVVACSDDGITLAFQPAVDGAEPAAVRRWLRERLPAHMVPAGIRQVEDWPLLTNGKTDHRRLAQTMSGEAGAASAPTRQGDEPCPGSR